MIFQIFVNDSSRLWKVEEAGARGVVHVVPSKAEVAFQHHVAESHAPWGQELI